MSVLVGKKERLSTHHLLIDPSKLGHEFIMELYTSQPSQLCLNIIDSS